MAGFGRSNSLSINTGSTGSSTLFGSNATQPQQTTQPQAQPQNSGGLFGSTQQNQQPSTGSLFGGLNKSATTTPPTQMQSGGLFGGSLQTQAQNTTTLGGPFSTQPKPTLSGAPAQQTMPPSLFGTTNIQQNQMTTPSLFGTTQQNQPQQQSSLFGSTHNQTAPLSLGGSTLVGSNLGASTQAVQMTLDSIRGTTRFNDLHPELQSLIQQFDEGIQRKIGYCNQIRETLPKTENDIATIAPDVLYIENFLSTVEMGLDNDSAGIAHLKELVKKDATDATLSFRAIENQRLPAQFHYRNSANLTASSTQTPAAAVLEDDDPAKPIDLVGYFTYQTGELDRTLDVYQHQIREIELHLRTMEAGTLEKAQQLTGSRSVSRDQRRELVEALKAIEDAILEAAKKVGRVRDEVTKQTLGDVGAALL